jgi:hypothetical protein
MAKERPIIFSTPMVHAILQGRKTQTRRVVKPQPKDILIQPGVEGKPDWALCNVIPKSGVCLNQYGNQDWLKCPYGQPGDLLWVRETWNKRTPEATQMGFEEFYYKAGWDGCTDAGWKPSIHMPKDAARIWLRLADVKVERLHDISEIDAAREGLLNSTIDADRTAKLWFYNLWKSIHGPGSLEKNPWVWVLSFEVLSTEGRKEAKP